MLPLRRTLLVCAALTTALAPACTTPQPIPTDTGHDAGSLPDVPLDAPVDTGMDAPAPLDAPELPDVPENPDAPPPRCAAGSTFGAPILVASLSAMPDDDDGLSVTGDELEAIVRSGASNVFWLHTRTDLAADFGAGVDSGVTMTNVDQGPFLSADGLELYFSSTRMLGIAQMFRATRASRADAFGAPAAVTTLFIGPANVEDPYVVGDTMYFSGTGPSAGRGIFTATRDAMGMFGAAVVLGGIDTGNNERAPVVSEDGLEIFFARNGASTSDDICSSVRATVDDVFPRGAIVSELRSGNAEHPEALSPDGCRLYFVSDRNGGRWDVYVAERTPL